MVTDASVSDSNIKEKSIMAKHLSILFNQIIKFPVVGSECGVVNNGYEAIKHFWQEQQIKDLKQEEILNLIKEIALTTKNIL